jgi:hypothetical protein
MVTAAKGGSWGMGMSVDFGVLAVLFSAAFPELAIWDAIVGLVTCPVSTAEQKAGACQALAAEVQHVPEAVRVQLIANMDAIALSNWDPFSGDSGGMAFPVVQLRIALGLLDDDAVVVEAVGMLASGVPQQRQQVAALLGLGAPPVLSFVLPALLGDSEENVRSEAAFTLGAVWRSHPQDTVLTALGRAVCVSPGRLMPLNLLAGLGRDATTPLTPNLTDVIGALRNHPSSIVRRRATALS